MTVPSALYRGYSSTVSMYFRFFLDSEDNARITQHPGPLILNNGEVFPYSEAILNILVQQYIETTYMQAYVYERRVIYGVQFGRVVDRPYVVLLVTRRPVHPGRRDIIYPDDRDIIDMGLGPRRPSITIERFTVYYDHRAQSSRRPDPASQ
ncbi:uncharacterized protein [Periplaneta americana]|uniref:uncharacterized protein n=1 Tax=Periplaneta americana TaxID=6978 RepID=UPI0037E76466